jgi:hypothetical protein
LQDLLHSIFTVAPGYRRDAYDTLDGSLRPRRVDKWPNPNHDVNPVGFWGIATPGARELDPLEMSKLQLPGSGTGTQFRV